MFDDEKLVVSSPGRICLFGEHQDYLDLPVIASAISLRINIVGSKRQDKCVQIKLPDINADESFILGKQLKYTKERDYFRSAVNVLIRQDYSFSNGFECTVKSDIPIRAGTSSSSALTVAWINFLAKMSDQQAELAADQIARFAHEAEVLEFNEPGGTMDHYATALGGFIYLESYPENSITPIQADLGAFVLGDSLEPKDTKNILTRVKNQNLEIKDILVKNFPEFSFHNIQYSEIPDLKSELNPEQLKILEATIRNRDITIEAKKMLAQKLIPKKEIGNLMNEHHQILRDDLKISTSKIETMINVALEAGAYGAKINGSGGGGCMFAYAPEDPERVAESINKVGGRSYIVHCDTGTKLEIERKSDV